MIELAEKGSDKNGSRRRINKVYYAYYDHERWPPHPVIHLAGKYLKQYGFNVGDRIEVVVEPDQISIRKIPVMSGQFPYRP